MQHSAVAARDCHLVDYRLVWFSISNVDWYPSRMPDLPILYTAVGCDESPKVREWLTERGVAFVERNVNDDSDAVMALYGTGTFATPLLVIGGRQVLGYRPKEIAEVLTGNRR